MCVLGGTFGLFHVNVLRVVKIEAQAKNFIYALNAVPWVNGTFLVLVVHAMWVLRGVLRAETFIVLKKPELWVFEKTNYNDDA